jgi:hypothetical protein
VETRILKETSAYNGMVSYTAQRKNCWGTWVDIGHQYPKERHAKFEIDELLEKHSAVKKEVIEYPPSKGGLGELY